MITPDISGGTRCYAIEDPLRSKFYLVGVAEFTFISLLDGRTSVAGALSSAAQQLGQQALVEQEALAICQWLLDSQLAQTDDSALATRLCESAEKNAERRLLGHINPLMIKIPLLNPDRLLAAIGPRLSWLLSPGFFFVWMAACLYAVYLVAIGWNHLAVSAAVILDRENWLRLAVVWGRAQVAARVGARPGVQEIRRDRAGGRSRVPLLRSPGIRRRNFVLAIPFQVASHGNGGGRHVCRVVRGGDRRDLLVVFVAGPWALPGPECRRDGRFQHRAL